jgi:hypothetical protein
MPTQFILSLSPRESLVHEIDDLWQPAEALRAPAMRYKVCVSPSAKQKFRIEKFDRKKESL